jgi:hypothetical protein
VPFGVQELFEPCDDDLPVENSSEPKQEQPGNRPPIAKRKVEVHCDENPLLLLREIPEVFVRGMTPVALGNMNDIMATSS